MSWALLTFNTADFIWSSENKVFTAEISELGVNELGRVGFHITDDRFILLSDKTGVEMVMNIDVINRDKDNDVESWVYRPENDEYDFTVTIYND